ncbi:MAG: ATP synthase F0 subunit B [Eubacteriales bacterium]|jgi:F-type H+-transporting ATPase subunit b
MLELDINLVFIIIDLLILYFILKKFLFGRVRNIMAERKKQIDDSYAEVDAKKKEAEDLKAQYEQEVASIQQTKEDSLQKARKDATAEYDRIVADARTRSDAILEETRRKSEAQSAQARQRAEDEISSMVKKAAAKIAESESDRSLYNAFLDQTEKESSAEQK